jgi:hypothetical protein
MTTERDTAPVFAKQETAQLMHWFRQYLVRRVSLDVWTREESSLVLPDRDRCEHCTDVVRMMRQLATMHPAIQFTHYDLDRHADRAAEASIEQPPTTIIRGAGRSVQLVGLFWSTLFPSMLDIIRFASAGATPLLPSSKSALSTLDQPVEIEAMLAAYDQYSAHFARLTGALAIESRHIHLRLVEASEFPVLAGRRAVTEVPLLIVNGRRFTGVWDEQPLVEQVMRVAQGDEEPVIRDRVLASPYYTEDQVRQIVQEQQRSAAATGDPSNVAMPADSPPAPGAPPEEPPATGGSGLIIPGR